jgi:hypothetical protein
MKCAVEGAGGSYQEAGDAAREGSGVAGLDDRVDVIGLDGEVDDAEAVGRRRGDGAAEGGEWALGAQRRDLGAGAEGDVDGLCGCVVGAGAVGDGAAAVGDRRAAGAAPSAAPGGRRRELELVGAAMTATGFEWGHNLVSAARICGCVLFRALVVGETGRARVCAARLEKGNNPRRAATGSGAREWRAGGS